MRVVMGLVFAVAALAFVVGIVLLLATPGIAGPIAAAATLAAAILGVILEYEIKLNRALLREIRDRLPRA